MTTIDAEISVVSFSFSTTFCSDLFSGTGVGGFGGLGPAFSGGSTSILSGGIGI